MWDRRSILAGEKLFPTAIGGLRDRKNFTNKRENFNIPQANEERKKFFLISWEILFSPSALNFNNI